MHADCENKLKQDIRALADFTAYNLSHGLGVLDSLMAHTAIESQKVLCTFNVKHYQSITSLETLQPYSR